MYIISRYNEPLDWLDTNDYIIYNKGEKIINADHIINLENIGGNQRDICKFICDNYNTLPNIMIFIQAFPFDHCKKDVFFQLILETKLTPIEYYGNIPANSFERRDEFGGYLEINNNWFIDAHNKSANKTCAYTSFDSFMEKFFYNYKHLDWIRFAPGSQYLVPKKNALQYTKKFWETLLHEMDEFNGTTAHIVERALFYIFRGDYESKYV